MLGEEEGGSRSMSVEMAVIPVTSWKKLDDDEIALIAPCSLLAIILMILFWRSDSEILVEASSAGMYCAHI
jgi:hypothetical protein